MSLVRLLQIVYFKGEGDNLGPVYTMVEKASGRSRMLGQDMAMRQMVDVLEKN
jgi:hypothetical protein